MQWKPENKFSHQYWMNIAVDLAKSAKTEVPIAALIVKENKLISQAVNQIEDMLDATAHAEILAIKKASDVLGDWRLTDVVLYSTLEPCSMCAGAIINSRISKVIFGAYDYDFGACGSKINLFFELKKDNQIEVIGGILEEECSVTIKNFFAGRRGRS